MRTASVPGQRPAARARPHRRGLRRLLLAALLAFPLAPATAAEAYRLGPLVIEQPWSRATAPGTPVGAGYLVIRNEGEADDRLVGARSPVASRVTLHRSVEADGVARMEHQGAGIPIPAGATVRLAPGGYHLMLMQLEKPLEKGGRVPVTLRFEHAGTIGIELEVRAMTAGVE